MLRTNGAFIQSQRKGKSINNIILFFALGPRKQLQVMSFQLLELLTILSDDTGIEKWVFRP